MAQRKGTILLTIDVEDWFQVENFRAWVPYESWDSYELRVEKNVHRLLDLFDEMSYLRSSKGIQSPYQIGRTDQDDQTDQKELHCTFFVLGWIAERLPHLIREIHSRGHEIASHGYRHGLCADQRWEVLNSALSDSKKILEDTIGAPVFGFRAPNFSVNDEVIAAIKSHGYLYDSSYNSFSMQGRYGRISLDGNCRRGVAYRLSHDFFELPISNLEFSFKYPKLKRRNFVLPWGGGGYFRFLPFLVFAWGVKRILEKRMAYLFYVHPWEIDPGQPRLSQASRIYRFRQYVNLESTFTKLKEFLKKFSVHSFRSCNEYIEACKDNYHVP
jgi:peptidoglycan-N-acetylglucosamine deacetylase